MIVMAELMAQSRSGILVIAVATLVLLPAWPRAVRRRIYIGSVPALIAARVVFPGLLGTIQGLFLGYRSDPSYQFRVAWYPKIFHYISDHPFFGRGFQTFDAKTFFPVDNQFLMSLIETGIIGTLIFVALLVTAITLAAKSAKWATSENERLLAVFTYGVDRRRLGCVLDLRLLQLPDGDRKLLPAGRLRRRDVANTTATLPRRGSHRSARVASGGDLSGDAAITSS